MKNEIALLQGRKFLGPLDKAVIRNYNARINFAKTMLLQEHVKELQDIEEQLEDPELSVVEKAMITAIHKLKEEQFHDFLGLPYGKIEDDKLPKT